MRKFGIVFGLLAVAGCAAALPPVGTDRIGTGYTTGGGAWDSGGGITVVARAVERDGVTAVCGAWMTDRQSALSVNFNEDVLQAGSAFAGEQRLVNGLAFMRRTDFRDDLSGQTANCVATSLPWQASFGAEPLDLRFPRVSFNNSAGLRRSTGLGRISQGPGAGDTVTFRQTPRPSAVL